MVAIKNYEMPKSCNDCPMSIESGFCESSCRVLDRVINFDCYEICQKRMSDCPLIEINPLTDDEKRIFLSAMNREEGLCEAIDNEKVDDGSVKKLLPIVKKLERKVKNALWR